MVSTSDPVPLGEAERLAVLRRYEILDTEPDMSKLYTEAYLPKR